MGRRLNQTYHTRAERQGLRSRAAREIYEPWGGIFQPKARPCQTADRQKPRQMTLDFEGKSARPLADVFPEAYE
jgi:hypothetical protein